LEKLKVCSIYVIHSFSQSDSWISGIEILAKDFPFDLNPLVSSEAIRAFSFLAKSVKKAEMVEACLKVLEEFVGTEINHVVAHAMIGIMEIIDIYEPVKTKITKKTTMEDSVPFVLPEGRNSDSVIIEDSVKRKALLNLARNQEDVFDFPWIRENLMEFIGRHHQCAFFFEYFPWLCCSHFPF
jgi:hypothetical protein